MVLFVVLERFGDAADDEKAAKGAPGRNDPAVGTGHKFSVEGIGGWGHSKECGLAQHKVTT